MYHLHNKMQLFAIFIANSLPKVVPGYDTESIKMFIIYITTT